MKNRSGIFMDFRLFFSCLETRYYGTIWEWCEIYSYSQEQVFNRFIPDLSNLESVRDKFKKADSAGGVRQ